MNTLKKTLSLAAVIGVLALAACGGGGGGSAGSVTQGNNSAGWNATPRGAPRGAGAAGGAGGAAPPAAGGDEFPEPPEAPDPCGVHCGVAFQPAELSP